MPTLYLKYAPQDGYIHNWLAAGPQAITVRDMERLPDAQLQREIWRRFYRPGIAPAEPVEEQKSFALGEASLTWRYARCLEDHLLDLATPYGQCAYLQSWAYSELVSPSASEATFVLTTFGPAELWLNDQLICRDETFSGQLPHSVECRGMLLEGANRVLVRLEQVSIHECPYAIALRVAEPSHAGLSVRVPTCTPHPRRRQRIERALEEGYIERDLYGWEDHLRVCWSRNVRRPIKLGIRVQTPEGRIVVEARPDVRASFMQEMLRAYEVQDGPYRVRLMADPLEFHMGQMLACRELDVHILRGKYSDQPAGDISERAAEALQDAARRPDNLYAEVAKAAIGWWSMLDVPFIRSVIERVNAREADSDVQMMGILALLYRFADNPSFPADLAGALRACVLGFRYGPDEPGLDTMDDQSEDHALLLHTCQVLAGQRYPERTFDNAGRTGHQHQELGERRVLEWLSRCAAQGLAAWNSPAQLERCILALVHLVDLAENDTLHELAAVVLDKLLFGLALNSFKGVLGAAHGDSHAPYLTDGRIAPTSGVGKLLWGMGCYNPSIAATVSLACSEEYSLPTLLASIAQDRPDEMLSRECHVVGAGQRVHVVTYKTPDYMLSSAQDYRPGELGAREHIWQATLGPDAMVFVNHPACASQKSAYAPNFWAGNRVLPRVAQWRDVLVAIYRLPQDDWMGFTHARWPVIALDDNVLRRGWAFARKGDGYLALRSSAGLELIKHGVGAYRELRSYGRDVVWLCQMGRKALDGDFASFQTKVLAQEVSFDGPSVYYKTLRGDALSFGWEGPLWVNGQPQPLSTDKHYENPYCVVELGAPTMDIQYGEWVMRLDFAR